MSYSTIAIIYNPNSTGPSQKMAKSFEVKLKKALPTQKIELFATEHAGHAEEITHTVTLENDNALIISASGDGGYNEVVNAAMKAQKQGKKVTTALLPAGNANDHHSALHDSDIIEHIKNQQSEKIDILSIQSISDGKSINRYGHSYIGFGMTPFIGNELNKTNLSFLKEKILVLRGLIKTKLIKMNIDGSIGHYQSIIFSNIHTMSKYLTLSKDADVCDGLFEVTITKTKTKFELLETLLRASLAEMPETKSVKDFSLETVDKTLVQIDGEILKLDASEKVVISIEHKALSCIV